MFYLMMQVLSKSIIMFLFFLFLYLIHKIKVVFSDKLDVSMSIHYGILISFFWYYTNKFEMFSVWLKGPSQCNCTQTSNRLRRIAMKDKNVLQTPPRRPNLFALWPYLESKKKSKAKNIFGMRTSKCQVIRLKEKLRLQANEGKKTNRKYHL